MSNSILSAKQIRQKFLDFFASKQHQVVSSSPVVPHDDPTLMFTNAGMNQFKGIFLGDNPQGLKRATSSQKCIRAGGKHNDLENVGNTARHLTFFEMLGNFSFGDYFKREAILYAWEFLTSKSWLGIDSQKLLVTVYASDDEAFDIWNQEVGLAPDRIIRIGDNKGAPYASDNFWQMGDTGPCGPCSEIFYDHGEHIWGGPPGSKDEDGDRFIEIWNNVFMQFNRDESGQLNPLPKQSVDTGMGLERITAVLQGKHSNYQTDIFTPMIKAIAQFSGVDYSEEAAGLPHRVISDHIRTISFAIADGVMPSNEGRGYVIRRILRRASRFARNLGQREAFLVKLLPTLVEQMGEAFPELVARQDFISQVIRSEEDRFLKTLDTGLGLFEKLATEQKSIDNTLIPGDKAFQLYDTYGFPLDLTRLIAKEEGLDVDEIGFETAMAEQKKRARAARKEGSALADESAWTIVRPIAGTDFLGYELSQAQIEITRFRVEDDLVYFIAAQSPFYAESGGQVGEKGQVQNDFINLHVLDTIKVNDAWLHRAKVLNGEANLESMSRPFQASVNFQDRSATRKNHSATHLLHAALRQVLGEHVTQQGSRVDSQSLRFDFQHPKALSSAELKQVELLVNQQIQANLPVQTALKNIEDAKADGAMALFGEKYGDTVRVVNMGDFSAELCGGLHVQSTGEIGAFRISSETATAAGVRRIEAFTAQVLIQQIRQESQVLTDLQSLFRCKPEELLTRVNALFDMQKKLDKEIGELNDLAAAQLVNELKIQAKNQRVIHLFQHLDKSRFAKVIDQLASSFDGISIIANIESESASIAVTVAKSLQAKAKAGELVSKIAALAGGKGGGRPDRAQAGTKEISKIPAALAAAETLLVEVLG